MTPPRPRDLVSPEARALGDALEALPDTADAAALSAVRSAHPEADPTLISALATQVRLRRRAVDRLGPWSGDLVLDEEALQQATRRDVALYRAAQLLQRFGRDDATVADLGCGLGIDARALAEQGFSVIAVERDPWRAEAAEVNLAASGDRVRVVCADVTTLDADLMNSCDAAYVDPARRAAGGPRRIDGGRARSVHAPDAWSPPWSWIVSLAEHLPTVTKVAPGFDAHKAPARADIEWIDHQGETVEASVWLGSLGQGTRRATALHGDRYASIEVPRDAPPDPGLSTAQASTYLLEPTPAVVRADLVGTLAVDLAVARLDGGTWLTAETVPETALIRGWRITEEIPHRTRDLRAWLRGKGSVTWKTLDAHVSATEWDRRVGHRPGDGPAVTVVITGQDRAFAVERSTLRGESDASSR
ncbi:MAG: hypothetical protein RL134_1279 [Actinomycetota bacterium]